MRYSPLRYPGGKAKLVLFFQYLIKQNHWENRTYIEPFAGGANVALSLLIEGYAADIIINDADPAIYAFWHSILTNTKKFIRKIKACELTLKEWRKQKQILLNPKSSEFALGFAAFYLNRTNFSGVLLAGPLGGMQQNGLYKLGARFSKESLIGRIKLIASYRKKITVTNKDAIELIKDIRKRKKCLVYFDPPYYVQGKRLYTSFYTSNDHEELSKKIKSLSIPLIITYDNVKEIKRLYQGLNMKEFFIRYSANQHTQATEIMFYRNIPNTIGMFDCLK